MYSRRALTRYTDLHHLGLHLGRSEGAAALTYSIVARCPRTGAVGVAVQTHWFAVGATVPVVEPGVGAIATQSVASRETARAVLTNLRAGENVDGALEEASTRDQQWDIRQIGVVTWTGQAYYTGHGAFASRCGGERCRRRPATPMSPSLLVVCGADDRDERRLRADSCSSRSAFPKAGSLISEALGERLVGASRSESRRRRRFQHRLHEFAEYWKSTYDWPSGRSGSISTRSSSPRLIERMCIFCPASSCRPDVPP